MKTKTPIEPISPDPRHLSHGREIPTVSYSDQPFIVRTDDGAWLCCVTTGEGMAIELRIAPEIARLNVYGRVLRTFEAVARATAADKAGAEGPSVGAIRSEVIRMRPGPLPQNGLAQTTNNHGEAYCAC